jgi:hypothetical protein
MFSGLQVKRGALLGICCFGYISVASAQYFDITSLTAGVNGASNGSFSGSLGVITVTGSATSLTAGSFTYNSTSSGSLGAWELSNTGGTSPQFSYGSVYLNPIATTDAIGYTFWGGATNTARITLNFSAPVSNLVFQVANIDNSVWDFTASGGVSSLTLLRGNDGADGDGIGISGKTIIDRANLDTGQAPSATPFTNGTAKRSAYGSVRVNGTYSTLTIDLTAVHSLGGDGGNFTFAIMPEPSSFALSVLGLGGGACFVNLRRRRK